MEVDFCFAALCSWRHPHSRDWELPLTPADVPRTRRNPCCKRCSRCCRLPPFSVAMAESKPSKKEAAFGDAKGRGNAAVQAADWWLAVECYTEALKAAPSTHFEPEGPAAAVLSNRSLAHLKCGLFEKALQDANDCIKMRPDWSKAHFRR